MEYDYNVSCWWKFEKAANTFDGTVEIKEMDAVSGKEPAVDIKFSVPSPEAEVEPVLASELRAKVRACIVQFLQELNAK